MWPFSYTENPFHQRKHLFHTLMFFLLYSILQGNWVDPGIWLMGLSTSNSCHAQTSTTILPLQVLLDFMKLFKAKCSTDLETLKSLQYDFSVCLFRIHWKLEKIVYNYSHLIVEYNEHCKIFTVSLSETPGIE